MDMELFFSQLANFGFPVVLSWYLLVRMENKLDKLTESIATLTQSIARGSDSSLNLKY